MIIVRSTIDLAHNLGLRMVAEGVETEAILNQLCQLGRSRRLDQYAAVAGQDQAKLACRS